MTIELVLRADETPIAFGPAKHLLELLEIAADAMPPRVQRCILHQLDGGISGKCEDASLTDGASIEGQIRYSLGARIERIFAAYAEVLSAHTNDAVHLRITAAHRLDEGTLCLFRKIAELCEGWTVSLQPGHPEGASRPASPDERNLLRLHTTATLSKDDANWLIARAQRYLHAGDAWTAAALLTPRAHTHGRPALHQVLAVANVVLDCTETAEHHYEAWARKGTPLDAARARYGQAMLYARHHPPYLHDNQRAAQLLDQAMTDLDEADPSQAGEVAFDRIFNRNGYALLQFRMGQVDAAMSFLDRALHELPDTSERNHLHRSVLLYNKAQILRRTGRSREAVREYQALLAIDPNMPEYHMELAQCLMDLGLFQAASEQLEQANGLDPQIPEGHALRAQAADQLEDSNALAYHREAWRLAPDRPDLAYAYAYALSAAGGWKQIIATLDRFDLAALPADLLADIASAQAEALLNLGRTTDAVDLLREAVSFAPGHPGLMQNLATVIEASTVHA